MFSTETAERRASKGDTCNTLYSPLLLCLQPQLLELVTIKIHARSFLYHMVRNIVGTLYRAGTGHLAVDEVRQILLAKDRCKAPKMAPAHGLYLVDVHYNKSDAGPWRRGVDESGDNSNSAVPQDASPGEGGGEAGGGEEGGIFKASADH